MSKISILCLFPPFHFCTVKTLQEDLLNSDFSNGHRAPLWGHRKTAATWFWWLIIRVIYLCLDNSTSTLKWPICACGPQVGHLVLHFQETQFQLIAGKNDQVSEKTSWWQTDNAYLVLCAQPPVSKRENTCCVLGALSLTYPVFPFIHHSCSPIKYALFIKKCVSVCRYVCQAGWTRWYLLSNAWTAHQFQWGKNKIGKLTAFMLPTVLLVKICVFLLMIYYLYAHLRW